MNLWSVEHFLTGLLCVQSKPVKKWEKKCSTYVKWVLARKVDFFFVCFGSKPWSETLNLTVLCFQKIKIIIFSGLQMMPGPILHLASWLYMHIQKYDMYCTKWVFPNHIATLRSLHCDNVVSNCMEITTWKKRWEKKHHVSSSYDVTVALCISHTYT